MSSQPEAAVGGYGTDSSARSASPSTVMISVGTENKRARHNPATMARMAWATVYDSVWTHRALIGNFALRELKAKYKGSILGSLWSLINPLATLGVYTLIFGFFLKFPPATAGNGTLRSFPVYLFTALVAWNAFSGLVTGTMGSLIASGGLLRKVYFPPSAPVFGSALASLNQTAIEFGLLIIAFIALQNISWTVVFVPLLLLFLFAFSLGVGLALSVVNARYRDVAYLVTITMSLLFYCEPIIYPRSFVEAHIKGFQTHNPSLPAPAHPWLQIYFWNPLTQFVDSFRDCLYLLKAPQAGSLLALAIWSFGFLAFGWWLFERGAREVIEEL